MACLTAWRRYETDKIFRREVRWGYSLLWRVCYCTGIKKMKLKSYSLGNYRCSRIDVWEQILKTRLPDTINNKALWIRVKQEPIGILHRRRKWRWIGHILRKGEGKIAKETLECNPAWSRHIGKARKTWEKTLWDELRGSQDMGWAEEG